MGHTGLFLALLIVPVNQLFESSTIVLSEAATVSGGWWDTAAEKDDVWRGVAEGVEPEREWSESSEYKCESGERGEEGGLEGITVGVSYIDRWCIGKHIKQSGPLFCDYYPSLLHHLLDLHNHSLTRIITSNGQPFRPP